MADTISALEWPAITILVRRSAIGNIDAQLGDSGMRRISPSGSRTQAVKRRHPASFHHTDKPVFSSDGCFIALPSQDHDRGVAGYGIGSCAQRQQNLSIPFHQVLVDRRHFRAFTDCAAAFGTRKAMLITSTKTVILIILTFEFGPSDVAVAAFEGPASKMDKTKS